SARRRKTAPKAVPRYFHRQRDRARRASPYSLQRSDATSRRQRPARSRPAQAPRARRRRASLDALVQTLLAHKDRSSPRRPVRRDRAKLSRAALQSSAAAPWLRRIQRFWPGRQKRFRKQRSWTGFPAIRLLTARPFVYRIQILGVSANQQARHGILKGARSTGLAR